MLGGDLSKSKLEYGINPANSTVSLWLEAQILYPLLTIPCCPARDKEISLCLWCTSTVTVHISMQYEIYPVHTCMLCVWTALLSCLALCTIANVNAVTRSTGSVSEQSWGRMDCSFQPKVIQKVEFGLLTVRFGWIECPLFSCFCFAFGRLGRVKE